MGKPRLTSIYIYQKMNRIWVDARFKNEQSEGPIGMIEVNFSLPTKDSRDVAEIEELATAKAQKYLGKVLNLMNDLAIPPQTNTP